MKYRVEQKYMITEDQAAYLKYKLEYLMDYDPFAKNGSYRIRSLYFDDFYQSMAEENEDGNDRRKKYRIRTYNNDLKVIHLEIKAKEFGYTSKEKESLKIEECIKLMKGQEWLPAPSWKRVKQEVYALRLMRGLHPVQIVEYDRIPFVENNGNVRITLDQHLIGCSKVDTFLEDKLNGIPILSTGRHILEVKYDEFIPDPIKKTLNEIPLTKTSFSKYYYAVNNIHLQR